MPLPQPAAAVRAGFALHPLSGDEEATCASMVARERGARLTLMPTHHVGEFGDLTGFRFDCGGHASGGCLPVSRRMFYGHTLAECLDGEGAILKMMSEAGRNREVMRGFLEGVERDCEPALLDCIPDNSDAAAGPGRHGLLQGMDLRTVDCKRWTPEVPELIGIYHAYLRGYNRDVRAHKMFIACSGGLEKASDAFCNLMIDAGKKWTAKEVAESEEAWWLRKACHRSRCRLIKGVADAFGLKVPHIQVCDDGAFYIHTQITDTGDFAGHPVARPRGDGDFVHGHARARHDMHARRRVGVQRVLRHDAALQRGPGAHAPGGGHVAVPGGVEGQRVRDHVRGQEGVRRVPRDAAPGEPRVVRGGAVVRLRGEAQERPAAQDG